MPPLVFAGECDDLKAKIAAVSRGEAFLLQGGDCAETFAGVTADNVRNKLRVLLQMAVVLTYAASVPVVKVGRIAGQYAKPRSSDLETRDGVTLPAYRGDAVNGFDFTAESRVPDPQRLVDVYNSSAATLNLVRAFVTGGYADLRQVHTWNTDFVRESPVGQRYELVAAEIERALTFMQAIGADPDEFHRVDFHSSHEALLLDYEHAMTRIDSRTETPYDVSAHFVWIGERTRQLDGAHVELFRHIRNPIGVKLGPTTTADDALALAGEAEPGQRAGPADLHHPLRRRQDPRRAARPGREGHRVRASRWRGSATRCTATPSRRPPATRPAASTTSSRRCRASSTCTARSAPGPAGSTSSSPATTSPSASAAARSSPRSTSARATSRSATRGSTGCSRWSWPSSSRRCCARPEAA